MRVVVSDRFRNKDSSAPTKSHLMEYQHRDLPTVFSTSNFYVEIELNINVYGSLVYNDSNMRNRSRPTIVMDTYDRTYKKLM